jgi:hypothetical protein
MPPMSSISTEQPPNCFCTTTAAAPPPASKHGPATTAAAAAPRLAQNSARRPRAPRVHAARATAAPAATFAMRTAMHTTVPARHAMAQTLALRLRHRTADRCHLRRREHWWSHISSSSWPFRAHMQSVPALPQHRRPKRSEISPFVGLVSVMGHRLFSNRMGSRVAAVRTPPQLPPLITRPDNVLHDD